MYRERSRGVCSTRTLLVDWRTDRPVCVIVLVNYVYIIVYGFGGTVASELCIQNDKRSYVPKQPQPHTRNARTLLTHKST